MNIWQIGVFVRSAVSALVVAFLLDYAARHDLGFSRVEIRTGALSAAILLGSLMAVEFFGRKPRKPK